MSDILKHMMSEDEFLEHVGVKGMKWGVRKRNPDYSNNQQKRDRQIYGKGGSRRINKNMNKGDSISVARGDEKTRRDRVMGRNKYVRQGGKVAGAVAGVTVANLGLTYASRAINTDLGKSIIGKVMKATTGSSSVEAGVQIATLAMNNPFVRVVASSGAAKVGTMLAGDAAVSANMRLNGYDPSRR